MRSILIASFLLASTSLFAGDNPRGTVPKVSASAYPAHNQVKEISLGATLLQTDQVRKIFVSNLNRCCVVVEVAVYPSAVGGTDVALNDFVLRDRATDTAVRPMTPDVVVAMLHKNAGSARTVKVSPSFGVGYQSGIYDPVTGPEPPGTVYQGGVNVATPSSGPRPGSTEKDRKVMEHELSERGLPEGNAGTPVSGYLYFRVSGKAKCSSCQLEYAASGNKTVLSLQ